MAELRFSGGSWDRRRRMLANDPDSGSDADVDHPIAPFGIEAFPLLSRDRLVRRFISPRLWKHAVLVACWTLLPFAVAAVWLLTDAANFISATGTHPTGIDLILRGLSGLELFVASQFCLLIYWVRAASAVDFRGGFRSWRWMSIILVVTSLLLVTGASSSLTNLIADGLSPLLGTIRSARPALLIVPAGALTAFVLRFLIPDMRRCRTAQILAIASAVFAVARIVAGLRWPTNIAADALALLELLTSGLVLSAFQLQCRYVIHVNPHPPVAAKLQGTEVKSSARLFDTASPIEMTHPAPVEVLPPDDTTPAAVEVTPSPQLSAAEIVIPANGQYSGGGSKHSRKKQRKAG